MKTKLFLKYRIAAVFYLLFCLLLVCSCNSGGSTKKNIEIRLVEQTGKDNTLIQIPEFTSENEEVMRNLRELEKKSIYLQKIVEKEQSRGSHMEMRSYIHSVKGYPQVTVVWYISEETTRLYNMMTLAADEKNSAPITCNEALEMTGMSGVDLSLNVGKLAHEEGIRGELQSMEMQGFNIDEKGTVREIYMKLVMKIIEGKEDNETEHLEEHFFVYNIEEDSLESLSGSIYDVP